MSMSYRCSEQPDRNRTVFTGEMTAVPSNIYRGVHGEQGPIAVIGIGPPAGAD